MFAILEDMQWSLFSHLYLIALPVFAIIDVLWIGVVADQFYTKQIGHLRGDLNWGAAVAFYLLFLAGLTYFVLYPAAQAGSIMQAAVTGALYGFFMYAAYDLTNMATLRDWPLLMTVVDMAWGVILGSAVSAIVVASYLFITS